MGIKIDWSVDQRCVKCNKPMRSAKTAPDGVRVKYGGMGECDSCRFPKKMRKSPESEASRITNLRKKYGLSDRDYLAMLEAQGNKCAICPKKVEDMDKPLYIDHDHSCCPGRESCGRCVRGLVCMRCNFALGHVDDRIEILESMISYLKGHSTRDQLT